MDLQETLDFKLDNIPPEQADKQAGALIDVASAAPPKAKAPKAKAPKELNRQKRQRELLTYHPSLRTASRSQLAELHIAISDDIRPETFIEKLYVKETAIYTWDIIRLQRSKTGIWNNALRLAVAHILHIAQFAPSVTGQSAYYMASEHLAYLWLFNGEETQHVSSLLENAGLDESAIEAEAYRIVADDLAKVDTMMLLATRARDKALRSVMKYRKQFAIQLRQRSDLALTNEITPAANEVES